MSTIYRSAAGRQAVEQRYRDYLAHWQVPAERRQIATREGETFVLACGPDDAPPVVLLHGAGTNSTIWLTDAAQWSQMRRVYLVDVIGEPGLSAASRPSLQSDAYAAWLDDVLDGLGVARAAFVGASLGGWLALDYAIRRPHRVERVALRAPGGVGRQKYGVVVAAPFLMLVGERGSRLALRLALGPAPDLGAFIDYMLLVHKHYRPRRDQLPIFSDEQLQALTTPLFVIVGADDRMLDSHDTARRLNKLVRHATVMMVPDAGHALTDDGESIHRFLTGGLDLRTLLRRDLGTALKARDAEAAAALRTAIAAIDNAEAVDPTTMSVGSTEVPRRDLSMADVRAILHNHIDDYVTEADRYQSLAQQDAAQRLRRQADTLRRYL